MQVRLIILFFLLVSFAIADELPSEENISTGQLALNETLPVEFYCMQDWVCTDWRACTNGSQARSCEFRLVAQWNQTSPCPVASNYPVVSRTCETCANQIQDGSETGVDCGGQCVACFFGAAPLQNVLVPRNAQSALLSTLVVIGMLSILVWSFRRRAHKKVGKSSSVVRAYIRVLRQRGVDDATIRTNLLRVGWDEEAVNEDLGNP